MEELKDRVEVLNGKIVSLTVRLEELQKDSGKGRGVPKKRKAPQKDKSNAKGRFLVLQSR